MSEALALASALTEVIWLAERIDITLARNEPLDLPALWAAGALSGDPAEAAGLDSSGSRRRLF